MAHMVELASDCASCSGLCCVALQFNEGSGFARSKKIGEACINLAADDGCQIHDRLRESGWSGCTVFECYGAGQRMTAAAGSWRDSAHPGHLFATFSALQALHEMLFLLERAPVTPSTDDERRLAYDDAAQLAESEASRPARKVELAHRWQPIGALRSRVGALLTAISDEVRAPYDGIDLSYQDRVAHDLRDTRLRGGSLRGATLIQADLRGADLTACDLLGVDLRDADLRGAWLSGSLFLTQPQINAATGDAATTLPPGIQRPRHWG